MIEESGYVVRSDEQYAWVLTQRRSGCASCSSKGSCGTGALSGVFGAKAHEVKVRNTIGARAGEEVVIGIREELLVRGSIVVYLMPLLTLIGGSVLGQSLAPQLDLASADAAGIVGGLLGLALGFFLLHWRNRRWGDNAAYQAETVRRRSGVALPVNFIPKT